MNAQFTEVCLMPRYYQSGGTDFWVVDRWIPANRLLVYITATTGLTLCNNPRCRAESKLIGRKTHRCAVTEDLSGWVKMPLLGEMKLHHLTLQGDTVISLRSPTLLAPLRLIER